MWWVHKCSFSVFFLLDNKGMHVIYTSRLLIPCPWIWRRWNTQKLLFCALTAPSGLTVTALITFIHPYVHAITPPEVSSEQLWKNINETSTCFSVHADISRATRNIFNRGFDLGLVKLNAETNSCRKRKETLQNRDGVIWSDFHKKLGALIAFW